MYTVDADIILGLFLKDREKVGMRELNEVRDKIERVIPDTYVDITKNCLIWAVNRYPELFYFRDYEITRVRELTAFEASTFYQKLPLGMQVAVASAVEKVKHAKSTTSSNPT